MPNFFGHAQRWEQIRRLVTQGELSHALLFYGPEGIGKKKFGLRLAEEILCHNDQTRHQMRQGSFPDFLLIESDSIIRVEAITRIQRFLSERPIFGDKKVVLVDDAHRMNLMAQNKFLKTLEEPPQFCHIILVTSQMHQLLETIRSRSMMLAFEPLPSELIYANLPSSADANDRRIATDFSQGSFGKALEILEDAERRRIFFLPPELFSAMIEYDYAKLLQLTQSVAKEHYLTLLDHLCIWLRDLSLIRENPQSQHIMYQNFRELLVKQSKNVLGMQLERLLERIEIAKQQIEYNVNPEYVSYAMLMDLQEEIHR